jgi:hypothetical protein
MLAHDHRGTTGAAPARDGCAAAALALPELDGVRLAILGLHTCQDSTVVHTHAGGPACYAACRPGELDSWPPMIWPMIWIRDSGGRWHATRTSGRSGMNGEVAMRVQVEPPLSRATARIELLAAGQPAQARATSPLRWE